MSDRINTLGQSRTKESPKKVDFVKGKGVDLSDWLRMEENARTKFVSNSLALSLIDVARDKKDSRMEYYFWSTFNCRRNITSSNGKGHANLCRGRICTYCNRVRKAEVLNQYFPELSQWEEPYFLTLTVKSCSAKRLPLMMDKMEEGFQIIKERLRKRASRGKGVKPVGIRSLECNFNQQKRTYNPHFHMIVKDKETAEAILKEWLLIWGYRYTRKYAQDIQPIWDVKTGLIEVVKYSTKIFTEPDVNKKGTGGHKVYVRAMFNIVKAMQNRRVFERFGFNCKEKVFKPVGTSVAVDVEHWRYFPRKRDWINLATQEGLTNCELSPELLELLSQLETSVE